MKRYGLILLLLLSLPAGAAEWIRVHPQADGDQYFYDRSKLYINGDEITYWKKVIFRLPPTVKGLPAANGLYRERIHCVEHTLKLISYLLYAADGSTLEYVTNPDSEAAPIIPDTVGDVFEQTTCNLVNLKREEGKKAPNETTRTVPTPWPQDEARNPTAVIKEAPQIPPEEPKLVTPPVVK